MTKYILLMGNISAIAHVTENVCGIVSLKPDIFNYMVKKMSLWRIWNTPTKTIRKKSEQIHLQKSG
jgi:hypothetical protein